MFLQFAVGFYEEDGTYLDSPGRIAQRYVTAPTLFLFDLVTSIPFAYVDIATYMVCCSSFLSTLSILTQHPPISLVRTDGTAQRCPSLLEDSYAFSTY